MYSFTEFTELLFEYKFIVTFLVLMASFLVKNLIIKIIKLKAKQTKRLKINMVSNIFTLMMIIVLFNLWSEEIQKFAFSIAAFIVAIVLATREFIQCFIGFIYILSSRPFRIGDWIQVGNYVGEVHSTDWAKLTLLEVNKDDYEYTGKTLYLPNSQLITSVIKNLNFLKRYAVHHFTIVRNDCVNPFDFMETLYEKANFYCHDFKDVAIRYNHLIESRLDIKIAGPEPHIQVATSELGDTQVFFTIFCPTESAMEIEQKLTGDFMRLWFEHKALKESL
ncbi:MULTISPECIES: mechanosensitive ion channel family protein [unclassified Colwellia]|nr:MULTISPECIES: mechanosensitive ion channel family protein [unclassified Colwellia]MBA6298635.1 mechanosensitive ion channel family protein [Colwellia sp. MB3u-22]MBA6302641.1 mechanosensitive ion channel family protein [Colwellia sp. MB02u-14]MBA6231878.1 mechanosensitive ion channel family protein [Colwellia sp. MB02u-7]MBA6235949.1 mechanosensitive ion channel family protein [Colwellia sp. MB02u-11]MBA6255215.1 mechanosensitive ion channel family protein [Colwellia sp. MB3u-28]